MTGSDFQVIAGISTDDLVRRHKYQLFSHGLRVFQASVVGPLAGEAQVKPFFESIELPR